MSRELLLLFKPKFSPQSIPGGNLNLWLDSADFSTITKDGTDKVSQQNDKSGKGNHAVQGTGANQPTWTDSSINSKATVVYDNDDFMTIPDNNTLDFDSGTGFTIFMVVNFDGYDNQGSGINVLLAKGAATLASDTYNIQTTSGNAFWFQSGNNEINLNSGGAIAGVPYLLSALVDNADTRSDTYLNSATKTSNNSATVGSDNASDLVIGGDSGASRYAAGQYAEIIIYNRPLSSSERAAVELYLTNKWLGQFYPAYISNLRLWLDVTDATTVTKDGGNLVEQVSDKSALVNHATQANDAKKFTWTDAVQNGLPMLYSSDGSNYLSGGPIGLSLTNPRTLFIVMKPSTKAGKSSVFYHGRDVNSTGNRCNVIDVTTNANASGVGFNNASGNGTRYNENIVADTPYILTHTSPNFGKYASYVRYLNGTLSTVFSSLPANATPALVDSEYQVGIGRNTSASITYGYIGYIGEVIYYEKYLSADERARVEVYLSSKWGISLP